MQKINGARRKPDDWTNRVALLTVPMLRWGMDPRTGYNYPEAGGKVLSSGNQMPGEKWMRRFIQASARARQAFRVWLEGYCDTSNA